MFLLAQLLDGNNNNNGLLLIDTFYSNNLVNLDEITVFAYESMPYLKTTGSYPSPCNFHWSLKTWTRFDGTSRPRILSLVTNGRPSCVHASILPSKLDASSPRFLSSPAY